MCKASLWAVWQTEDAASFPRRSTYDSVRAVGQSRRLFLEVDCKTWLPAVQRSEVSSGLGVNMGEVVYHLLVLLLCAAGVTQVADFPFIVEARSDNLVPSILHSCSRSAKNARDAFKVLSDEFKVLPDAFKALPIGNEFDKMLVIFCRPGFADTRPLGSCRITT